MPAKNVFSFLFLALFLLLLFLSMKIRILKMKRKIFKLILFIISLLKFTPGQSQSSSFSSIDLQAFANINYGIGASVKFSNPNHIYDLNIEKDGRMYNIDMKTIVKSQLGARYYPVMTGLTGFDWSAISNVELTQKIVPIVIIPSDAFYDIADSKDMANNLLANINYSQKWYQNHMPDGKTFRLLDKTIFVYSDKLTTYWNKLAEMTDWGDTPEEKNKNRFAYLEEAKSLFEKSLPELANFKSTIICASVWVGREVKASGLGAAASDNFVIQPPSVATSQGRQHIYAIGHELGHAFGLPHSCELYNNRTNPSCDESIMQNPGDKFLQVGTLLPEEKAILFKSLYFK
jgi:hypothetical protein